MAGKPLDRARKYAEKNGITILEAMEKLGLDKVPRLNAYFDRIAKATEEIDKNDEDLAFNLRQKVSYLMAQAYKHYNRLVSEGIEVPEELERLHKLAKEVIGMFPLPKTYGRPDTSGLDAPQSSDWLTEHDIEGKPDGESTDDGGRIRVHTPEGDGGEGDEGGEGEVPPAEDL